MHDKHQKFYDSLAAEWDLMFTAEDLELLGFIVDSRLKVEEGMNILDIGCGTGILFDMLRRKVGDKGSIVGIDFSIEMARKAHRNFPFANVNVVDADAAALPFEGASFDMAVAFSAFPHFANQQKAIDETHRVLKSGAWFHILHLVSSKEISEMHHRMGGVVENDEIPPEEKLRQMLDASRFTDINIDDRHSLYLASARNSR
jgi:ubiquinone/menaquinone biosynthesis C-methylase UbiE